MFKGMADMAVSSIGGSAQTQTTAPREGEIVEGLRALANAIDNMEGATMNLTSRISPVLRPAAPTTESNGISNEQYTPFGLELARLQTRIWLITRAVDDASGRLELP